MQTVFFVFSLSALESRGRGVADQSGNCYTVTISEAVIDRIKGEGIMDKSDIRYKTYVQILKEELIPAMGCTEPIAISYCAAKARSVLGCVPDRVEVEVSGNIIKNAKSVVVPNTGGLKGIAAAAAAGIAAGDDTRILEVIAEVDEAGRQRIRDFLAKCPIVIRTADTDEVLDIRTTLFAGKASASVRIARYHSNIVLIEKDGEVVYEGGKVYSEAGNMMDKSLLSIAGIFDFAESVDLSDVKDVLDRQISCNMAISEEGMRGDFGANIGRVLISSYGEEIGNKAKAAAAAGSDARMSGCEMPVIINSGSGNQGITVSVPVIVYAREKKLSDDRMYRALVVSNLNAIHLKSGIGTLSAYCGAVSAGCAAGSGIAYMDGAGLSGISHTLVNALGIISGIVCDGAKPSCAGKIAIAVDAGLLGYAMYCNGQELKGGDGIISKGVENTISNICRLSRDGMKETDKEIIRIMTD